MNPISTLFREAPEASIATLAALLLVSSLASAFFFTAGRCYQCWQDRRLRRKTNALLARLQSPTCARP